MRRDPISAIGRPCAADDHPGGRARDGRVVVEHAQRERLEQHGLGERRLDDEHGGAGEVQLALAIAPDGAREPVGLEPVEGAVGDDGLLAQPGELGGREAELAQQFEQASRPGDDAVATSRGQAAREHLEHTRTRRDPGAEGRVHHRELVAVGQQSSRRRRHGGNTRTRALP